jgi:3-deoxy-manno-octulosonate cytidylyltransferase (CMP-KDO synthetase)
VSKAEEFSVVIPARFASTRLPGKPLKDIGGLPMIIRVHRQALAAGATDVIIATDDERIAAAGREFGARVEMTSDRHRSGTDRVAELSARLGWPDRRIVVNVQGDEPLIPPALIGQVADLLVRHEDAAIATLATPFASADEFEDMHTAKVVVDRDGYALYFSRAPIPWSQRAGSGGCARRHIGLYGYRVKQLREFAAASSCSLERRERLEQLRALWLGQRIIVADAVERPALGVDTPEDLEIVRRLVAEHG